LVTATSSSRRLEGGAGALEQDADDHAREEDTSMKRQLQRCILMSVVTVAMSVSTASISAAAVPPPPPTVMIAIYHVAPGKHLEFLKWMAAREAVEQEVGAPAMQLYAHMDGDSWDYVVIQPVVEGAAGEELAKKVEAASAKKGLTTGPKRGIELRTFIQSHSDTKSAGPLTFKAALEAVTK
jgi:hypothetical protein